jgi:hypothetical protein
VPSDGVRWKFWNERDGWDRWPGSASRTSDPYGCCDGDDSRKKQNCPIFMPGELVGRVATLASRGDVPGVAGVHEAGRRGEQAAERRLAFDACGDVVGQR